MYTVKQLSDLAGVSVRTLHYYDEIGLLHPAQIGTNGYRYYDDATLLRLQQILFYREIGLELMQIKEILDQPDFDLLDALRSHRNVLQNKVGRMQDLVKTIDETISHLEGKAKMSKKRMFEAFSPEKQEEYERSARLQYGPDNVNESINRWRGYSQSQRDAIFAESGQIYNDLSDAMEAGIAPTSAEVQAMIERWHNNLRYFYEPTLEIVRGLAELYSTDPDFIQTFQTFQDGLPDYLKDAITQYADDLETAEIVKLLAADEEQAASN